MTDVSAALARLTQADLHLVKVEEDNEALTSLAALLPAAITRCQDLASYYSTGWMHDVDAVVAASDDPTPRAANQDAIWEALETRDKLLRTLLRHVTTGLAADVDVANASKL